MSRFQKYKEKRMARDPEFWEGYQERFETFKLGVLLRQARQDAGLTQEEAAQRLNISKNLISRMENHAPDVRLSNLEKFASILGKKLHVVMS